MNKSYCIRGLLCLALLMMVGAAPADAVVITFDPLVVFNDAGLHFVPGNFNYAEAGYNFFAFGGIIYVGTLHQGFTNAGSSTAVWHNSSLDNIRLTRIDSAEFVLHSVVLSKLNIGTGPASVNIVGHLPFGGTFTRNISLPDVPGTTTVVFAPAWNRLVSVEFRVFGSGARYQIDNVQVTLNTVPVEQSTWGHIKALYGE